MFTGVATSIQHMKSGKLVPLGVATAKRIPLLPDVPTIAESGLAGFDAAEWGGIMVPTGTPSAVGSTPEEFAAFIKSENNRWCGLIKKANITR